VDEKREAFKLTFRETHFSTAEDFDKHSFLLRGCFLMELARVDIQLAIYYYQQHCLVRASILMLGSIE